MSGAVVVGMGRMGIRHVSALHSLGFKVVSCVDSSHQALMQLDLIKELKGVERHTQLTEALARHRPQVVCIASTAPSHAGLVEEAITHGVPFVLCEKPLTRSLQEADFLQQISHSSSTRIAVNHQKRFLDRFRYIQHLIDSEEFGQLRSMTVIGSDFGLAMNGTHFIEIFEWMCGERIAKVFGSVRVNVDENPRGRQFKDYEGLVVAWTQGERRFVMDCSADLGHGVQLALNFERGKVTWDDLTGVGSQYHRAEKFRGLPNSRYGEEAIVEGISFPTEDATVGTARVISALLRNENYPSIADGASALRTVIAAILSSEANGRKIDVRHLPVDRYFLWP